MKQRIFRLAAALLAVAAALPAHAQTQAQQDRLNEIAKFVVTSPMCEQLGMQVDPDLPTKAADAVEVETAGWQVDRATVERLVSETTARQGAMLKTDLGAASANAKTDAQLRGLRNILLGYGHTCMAAAADPIFSALIVAPPGYDLERAATGMSDGMLEEGGLASWQTPRIQSRGDLMMLAGTCRSKIGAARSDALVKEFGQSDDPRVRNYYSKSFDGGLADPTIVSTLAGCNRAIAAYRAKAQ